RASEQQPVEFDPNDKTLSGPQPSGWVLLGAGLRASARCTRPGVPLAPATCAAFSGRRFVEMPRRSNDCAIGRRARLACPGLGSHPFRPGGPRPMNSPWFRGFSLPLAVLLASLAI